MCFIRAIFCIIIGVSSGNFDLSATAKHSDRMKQIYKSSHVDMLERGQIISKEKITTLSKIQLSLLMPNKTPLYDVELYRLIYASLSSRSGESIAPMSSVVMIPKKEGTTPLIFLHHVMITANENAPSNRPIEGLHEASQGYLVFAHDYLGFGASKHIAHPYMVAEAYQNAGVDGLKAIKEFIADAQLSVPYFFLQGYSEGAYGALALQKALETNHELKNEWILSNFSLKGTHIGAGPYMIGYLGHLQAKARQLNPLYLLPVIYGYKNWYHEFEASYDDFFEFTKLLTAKEKASTDAVVGYLMNGSKSVEQLDILLGKNPQQYIRNPLLDYLGNLNFDANFQQLPSFDDPFELDALLEENAIIGDWIPSTPIYMFHCAGDQVIPSIITKILAQQFFGSEPNAPVQSKIFTNKGFDHGSCIELTDPVKWYHDVVKVR